MQNHRRLSRSAAALALALVAIAGNGSARAKQHKKLASSTTSPCADSVLFSGTVSKEEKRRIKHKCIEDNFLKQDLSGDSGPYIIGG